MRIAVLSQSDEIYSTRRLLEQARARGHDAHLLRILHARLAAGADLQSCFDGAPPPLVDCVVPRVGSFFPDFALAQLRVLERAGVRSLNPSLAIEIARDKFRSAVELAGRGLPVPRTVLVKDLDQLDAAIEVVGGAPVVIKPTHGAQGRGVMLASTHSSAISILEGMVFQSQDVIVQEYVGDPDVSKGSEAALAEDLRVVVLGGAPVITVRRRARSGRFRTNFHRGGTLERVAPNDPGVDWATLGTLAVQAAEAIGLNFAGVDIVMGEQGPLVLEVNPSPGWQGIESTLGVDVATMVVEQLEGIGQAPEHGGVH